jgi:hypothetical protein
VHFVYEIEEHVDRRYLSNYLICMFEVYSILTEPRN